MSSGVLGDLPLDMAKASNALKNNGDVQGHTWMAPSNFSGIAFTYRLDKDLKGINIFTSLILALTTFKHVIGI